jgi:hypothetical protein
MVLENNTSLSPIEASPIDQSKKIQAPASIGGNPVAVNLFL